MYAMQVLNIPSSKQAFLRAGCLVTNWMVVTGKRRSDVHTCHLITDTLAETHSN